MLTQRPLVVTLGAGRRPPQEEAGALRGLSDPRQRGQRLHRTLGTRGWVCLTLVTTWLSPTHPTPSPLNSGNGTEAGTWDIWLCAAWPGATTGDLAWFPHLQTAAQ